MICCCIFGFEVWQCRLEIPTPVGVRGLWIAIYHGIDGEISVADVLQGFRGQSCVWHQHRQRHWKRFWRQPAGGESRDEIELVENELSKNKEKNDEYILAMDKCVLVRFEQIPIQKSWIEKQDCSITEMAVKIN